MPTHRRKPWFDSDGNLLRRIPNACIRDCSQPGTDVWEAITLWQHKLHFVVPRGKAIKYLKEFGAWNDLALVSDFILSARVLWTLCCAAREEHTQPTGLHH